MAKLKEREEKVCLNCNAELHGRFCHECGQENVQLRRPIWAIPGIFLSTTFNLDSKFIRSLKYLLFRPGYLSKEFVDGKRSSYHQPIRMYLVTSFIFLFISSIAFNRVQNKVDEQTQSNIATKEDSIAVQNIESSGLNFNINTPETDTLEGDKMSKEDFAKSMKAAQDVIGKTKSNLPYLLWISLPAFALLLKLLYIRRKKFFYWDHLIFSIHLYSFNFLFICLGFGIQELTWLFVKGNGFNSFTNIYNIIAVIISSIYVFLGMKKFYGQNIVKTILKFMLLTFMVIVTFSLILMAFVLIAFRNYGENMS